MPLMQWRAWSIADSKLGLFSLRMLKEGFNTCLRLPKRGCGGLEMMSHILFCGTQQKEKRQQASLAAREILIRYQEKTAHTLPTKVGFRTCHRSPEQLRNLHPGRCQNSHEQGPEAPELVFGQVLLWAGGGTRQSRGQNGCQRRAERKMMYRIYFALVLPKPLLAATCSQLSNA